MQTPYLIDLRWRVEVQSCACFYFMRNCWLCLSECTVQRYTTLIKLEMSAHYVQSRYLPAWTITQTASVRIHVFTVCRTLKFMGCTSTTKVLWNVHDLTMKQSIGNFHCPFSWRLYISYPMISHKTMNNLWKIDEIHTMKCTWNIHAIFLTNSSMKIPWNLRLLTNYTRDASRRHARTCHSAR